MDTLFSKYFHKIKCSNEVLLNKEFLNFYENDKHIEEWLNTLTSEPVLKDDSKAKILRFQGNELYAKKKFKESFRCYTKGLCLATIGGNETGVIMANRSALLFMINDFKSCLTDIEFSLKCNCPDDVQMKLHCRRVKCLAKMNLKIEKAKSEALNFISKSHLKDKDAKRAEIASIVVHECAEIKWSHKLLPKLQGGYNPNFLHASSLLTFKKLPKFFYVTDNPLHYKHMDIEWLSDADNTILFSTKISIMITKSKVDITIFDNKRGRHVVAKEDIEVGNVLFVERPFIFANVFNEQIDFCFTKCYHCLKTIYSSVPCEYCTKTIYCNIGCRKSCWKEYHKWECFGMQCNLWYHIGIAFPAMRAIIKGITIGFRMLESDYEADTLQYGNTVNNYGYFNKLVSNLSKMDNILPLLISAGVVISYLEKYTSFFDWAKEQTHFMYYTMDHLKGLLGGRITKHIAQLQCNSSVIKTDGNALSDREYAACAVYPSISMMNHSCCPNIMITYLKDVAIVEAAEKVPKGEEVLNCYGIDFRYTNRQMRQEQCSQYYYFKCLPTVKAYAELKVPLQKKKLANIAQLQKYVEDEYQEFYQHMLQWPTVEQDEEGEDELF
ncbi:hypothetical protein FQA39_LY16596 [Lamprigera yunnana]|nr:hypothetical protein FQA39_LY16596 [Lamprigera yunnana]